MPRNEVCAMNDLAYREGYVRGLMDLAGFINRPNGIINKSLCTPKRLDQVMGYIIDHVDDFMAAPDLFAFEFVVTKKGLVQFQQ